MPIRAVAMTEPEAPIEVWKLDDPALKDGGVHLETIASAVEVVSRKSPWICIHGYESRLALLTVQFTCRSVDPYTPRRLG